MVNLFFLYSENTQDVHVSIAGDKCEIQHSNRTHIICMTRAHASSGWAPVHVSIRNIGMAKLVIMVVSYGNHSN